MEKQILSKEFYIFGKFSKKIGRQLFSRLLPALPKLEPANGWIGGLVKQRLYHGSLNPTAFRFRPHPR